MAHNTEIKLTTISGPVQYAATESELLAVYNAQSNSHEFRNGPNGRILWHKSHRRVIGFVEQVPQRAQ